LPNTEHAKEEGNIFAVKQFAFRCLILLFAIPALLMPAIVTPPAGEAAGAATADTTHGVRLASPAVVRIITNVLGSVTCRQCANDGSDIVFPLNGGSYDEVFAGSGAFISPDGYLLTADHVVDMDAQKSSIQQIFLQDAINEFAQKTGVTTDQATQDFQDEGSSISVDYKVDSQKAFLSTAYTGQLQNSAQVTGYAITRIVVNSTPDKQDTAIVKVEATDLPFLTLAPANSIHVQDTVTAVAYPADADTGDFTDLINPTQSDVNTINGLLSPSVNSGQITAQKTLSDGTLVYETDGIAFHGSSGGPIIDTSGRIIGFVDAGTDNARVIYAYPSEVAAEYVTQAGISSSLKGTFMTLWTKAVDEYDATGPCHWTNAYHDLQALQQQYDQFGAVKSLLDNARSKATPSECPPPAKSNLGLILGIGGVILLALLGGGFFLMRQRKQATPAIAGAPYLTPVPPFATDPRFPAQEMPPAPYPLQPTPPPVSPADPSPASDALTVPAPTSIPGAVVTPVTPAPRTCPAGHIVDDASAHYCPQCGATMPGV
jgi:S1-C subfamily serine protease